MRLRIPIAFITLCLSAMGQTGDSVGRLVARVRDQIDHHRSDSRLAKEVSKVHLAERLDDRTIEILESEGAGPQTVAELRQLRDRSDVLPRPAKPAIPEPPAPSAAEKVLIWDAAHDHAVDYTETLPDFICTEVVHRYVDPNSRGAWKLQDTLVLKLSYFDRAEDYQLMTVNNHPTSLSYDQMRGAITEGEFGSMLAAIFALKSRTNRDWDHWTVLRSRPTHVFSFAIAKANSEYRITSGSNLREPERVKVGQHGWVYIDDATKMVMRVVAIGDDLPVGFDVKRVELQLDYDFVDVGGKRYLLPLRSETKLLAPPFQHRNETEFLLYKKFSADTTITYKKN